MNAHLTFNCLLDLSCDLLGFLFPLLSDKSSLRSQVLFPVNRLFLLTFQMWMVIRQERFTLVQPVDFLKVVTGLLLVDTLFALIEYVFKELVELGAFLVQVFD